MKKKSIYTSKYNDSQLAPKTTRPKTTCPKTTRPTKSRTNKPILRRVDQILKQLTPHQRKFTTSLRKL